MLALRFISGKYEGGEFPLRPDREIRIGRQADFEMVLVEDMVSRKHARIMTHDDQITIEDLGSTNGTFINGQKVKHSALEEGDRVLIGTSLLRVVRLAGEGRSEKEARDDLSSRAKRSPSSGRFSGNLADVPLPDLLQLLTTGKKTGALRVDGPVAGGAVHVREGRIIHAELDDLEGGPPKKALFRMLGWADGSFELRPAVDVPSSLDEPTEGLLLDAMREIDELRRIAETLPGEDDTLLVPMPLQPQLRDLQPEELDVLQAAMNNAQVGLIVDQTPLTDYEAWRILVSLVERGYLVRQ
jgi:pSer/pThr/pTyr-binding forkhead associated (FHA) protein